MLVVAPGPRGVTREAGVLVHRLGGGGLFGWPGAWTRLGQNPLRALELPSFAWRLRDRLDAIGAVGRIVAHWVVPSAWPFCEGQKECPLEAWAHGADIRLLLRSGTRLRAWILQRLIDRPTRFVFVAHALRDRLCAALPSALAARLFDDSEVRPAPISVPARDDLADPRSARGGPRGDYAVWVGRLTAQKHPDVAVRAAAVARTPLVLVGDGPLSSQPGGFRTGRVPRLEALGWIAHARALVSTSRDEGAPTVVREARALGVPVVALPAGDIPLWAETDAGIQLARDERELASMLAALRP